MSDKPKSRNDLLAKLLAMKDLPCAPDLGPTMLDHAPGLSAAQIDDVRSALSGEVRDWLEDSGLVTKQLDSMMQEELDEVHDAVYRALMNAAPIVRSYTARQDRGTYPVWIAGIEGVYLLMASEHDTLGPFSTLSEAVDAMDHHYGKFLVGD